MKSASKKSKNPLIYVFWGDGFDSATATVFASAFRQKALGTKIVSVRGNNLTGNFGIKLTPDLTLGEAMATSIPALAYIIPCLPGSYARAENDPRLSKFLQTCFTPTTQIIIQSPEMLKQPSIARLNVKPEQAVAYGDWTKLCDLMDEVINRSLSYSMSSW